MLLEQVLSSFMRTQIVGRRICILSSEQRGEFIARSTVCGGSLCVKQAFSRVEPFTKIRPLFLKDLFCVIFPTLTGNIRVEKREDDAEEVFEKERANFCEWFKPAEGVFDAQRAAADTRSRDDLASLFRNEDAETPTDDPRAHEAAEDLFK